MPQPKKKRNCDSKQQEYLFKCYILLALTTDLLKISKDTMLPNKKHQTRSTTKKGI